MRKNLSPAKTATLAMIVLVILVGAAYAGYRRTVASTASASIATATVSRGTIQSSVPADGRVAVGQWELTFATNGSVESVKVSEGETVTAGEVLATVNNDQADAQVAQARGALGVARAKLSGVREQPRKQDVAAKQTLVDAAQSSLRSAQDAYDLLYAASLESTVSATELQAMQASVTSAKSQLDIAEANLTVAKTPASPADIAAAQAAVSQAAGGLDAAQSALADTILRAPGDGVVVSVGVTEGQTLSSSASQPSAIVVANLNGNYFEGAVDEADAGAVKVGMPVDALVDALDGKTVKGTVTYVGKSANVDSSGLATFPFRAETTGSADGLAAGMAARMQIITDRVSAVLIIPTVVVGRTDGKAVVNVVSDGGALVSTTVVLGRTDGKMVEVKSGLKEGQKVALSTVTAAAK